jgi:hypothetical protein
MNLRVSSTTSGQITLNWAAGPVGVQGAAATGYRVYASSNGYAFDAGTLIAGGGSTSATLSGYDPTLPYYFKLVAVNAGGESRGSEVVTVTPDGGLRNVLIVTGFDRQGRTQNVRYPYAHTGDGLVDRPWERSNNSYDYVVQYASAIHAVAPEVTFDTASNEAVINGSVNLNSYNTVIWILGEESTSTDTFNATEQAKVSSFLAAGGSLFASGSEIGWDLDAQGGGASFYNNVLRADYVADDANSYTATATAGSIFAALPSITFDNGAGFNSYNVESPDRILPTNGSIAALNYGSGGAAAIQYIDPATDSKLVMLAFPFESILSATTRNQVMERVLDYFVAGEAPSEVEFVLDNDDGASVYSETGSWTTSGLPGYNGTTFRTATAGLPGTAQWSFTAPFTGNAEVFVQYRASASRATNAVYQIDTGNGVATASADQTQNSLTWVSLGTFFFDDGVRTITLNAELSTGGSVVNADAVRVVLTAATAPDADFNDDDIVDGHDFLTWQLGLGTTSAQPANGDANGDGTVNASDLGIWRAQFGGPVVPPTNLSGDSSSALLASASAGDTTAADLVALAQHEQLAHDSLETRSLAFEEPSLAVELPTLSAGAAPLVLVGQDPEPASGLASQNQQADESVADEALESLSDWTWRQPL